MLSLKISLTTPVDEGSLAFRPFGLISIYRTFTEDIECETVRVRELLDGMKESNDKD